MWTVVHWQQRWHNTMRLSICTLQCVMNTTHFLKPLYWVRLFQILCWTLHVEGCISLLPSRVGRYPFWLCTIITENFIMILYQSHDIYSKKLHSTQTIHSMFFWQKCWYVHIALARCGSTMYPPELNTRSDGMLVPQINLHRYFPTSTENNGNLLLFCFDQSKGLLLISYSGRSP